jgi:hypothetical protein
MTIGRIKENDVVHCDVRGQRFWALAVEDGARGTLTVEPLRASKPRTVVKARQVIGHWRMQKGSIT